MYKTNRLNFIDAALRLLHLLLVHRTVRFNVHECG